MLNNMTICIFCFIFARERAVCQHYTRSGLADENGSNDVHTISFVTVKEIAQGPSFHIKVSKVETTRKDG